MTECAELCRIALAKHETLVSRILSIAVRMLKREMPGIRLLVSYADLNQGHVGKIYQASNWVFDAVGDDSLQYSRVTVMVGRKETLR